MRRSIKGSGSFNYITGTVSFLDKSTELSIEGFKIAVYPTGGIATIHSTNLDIRTVERSREGTKYGKIAVRSVGLTCRWLNSEVSILAIIKTTFSSRAAGALCIGVESIEEEIAIRETIPAPVDMEIALAIVAITHERVTTIDRSTIIDHRADILQVIVNHITPDVVSVIISIGINKRGVVIKIIDKRFTYFETLGTGSVHAIHHFDRITAGLHQVGNSISLSIVIIA